MSKCSYRNTHGLTLVELLVAIAIVSILLMLVTPNMLIMIKKSRITGHLNELSSALQYAKLFAIEHRSSTLLCPSIDYETCDLNWDLPLILFIDKNQNAVRDLNEHLLRTVNSQVHHNHLKGPGTYIRFYESGANSSPATLVFCPQAYANDSASTSALNQSLNRALFVSLQGRTRVSVDSDGDNIHESAGGSPLSCL